jgi:hypothetical protein
MADIASVVLKYEWLLLFVLLLLLAVGSVVVSPAGFPSFVGFLVEGMVRFLFWFLLVSYGFSVAFFLFFFVF